MKVVRANGLVIAYERIGEGPPLVFVHGAADDGRVWQPQLAALADDFTVVAWDEPGAGRSSDPSGFRPSGLRELPRGADRGGGARPGARRRPFVGRHCRTAALPPPSPTRRDADSHRYLRRLERSLPEEEVRARVAGAREMLAAAAEEFDPTLPGLFAGDPPAEFVPQLDEIAADARPESGGSSS